MDLLGFCRDDTGQTAFHWAAWLGLTSIMDTLALEFELQAARDAENLRSASEEAGMEVAVTGCSLYTLMVSRSWLSDRAA